MVTKPIRKDVIIMLPQTSKTILLPKEMQISFSELKISTFLKKSNITKAKGASALYLFSLIFLLTFNHRTWFQSKFCYKKSIDLLGKDSVYRFLSTSTYNWRKFLLLLSHHTIWECFVKTELETFLFF